MFNRETPFQFCLTRVLLHSVFIAVLTAGATALCHAQAADKDGKAKDAEETPSEQPASEKRAAPPNENQRMKVLSQHLDPGEVRWLKAEEKEFLALYRPMAGGTAKGAILLLDATEAPGNRHRLLETLRTTLTEHGWHSLAIGLPEPVQAPPPKRTREPFQLNDDKKDSGKKPDKSSKKSKGKDKKQDSDNGEQTAEAKTEQTADQSREEQQKKDREQLAKAQQHVRQRIESALQYLTEQGQLNIVIIGHGSGGQRALHYLSGQTINKAVQGLVLIEAPDLIKAPPSEDKNDGDQTKDSSAEHLKTMPLLDILAGSAIDVSAQAKNRRRQAARAALQRYEQWRLPTLSPNWQLEEDRLSRRIRGWLQRNVSGQEVRPRRP